MSASPVLSITVTCPCCDRDDDVTVRAARPSRGYCARCDEFVGVPAWHRPYCLLEYDGGYFALDAEQQAAARAAVAALRLPGKGQGELPGTGVPR